MDQKSLEVLELPKLKGILAAYTTFSVSYDLALSIEPQVFHDTVKRLLKQSTEARQLLALEPNLSLGQPVDSRQTVHMTTIGKVLDPKSLLDIRSILIASNLLQTVIRENLAMLPSLWEMASQLVPLPQLAGEIERCIDPSGEVLDTASAKLGAIRNELRETRRLIIARLERIMRDEDTRVMIQDDFVTERAGRYVIPVKIDFQGRMKGIIHDVSNTEATVFVEPMATVELGNRLRQLVTDEEQEILRILSVLSGDIAEYSDAIISNTNLLAELDLALAKGRFARDYRAVEARIAPAEEDPVIRLKEARHPLLKEKAVPISVEIGAGYTGLVITGPNTGGKTVSLKTIGLLTLMTQSGLPIPASGESRIPVFDNIFADMGDEQSIEETLSSFSWHMGNIVRVVGVATDKSLVLLDELGTSTDPAEGAALAQSIMLHFVEKQTLMAATTHFAELKAFAYKTPGLSNASMEFDPVTLSPTYHMLMGVPGGSNALAIAAHLGLPLNIIERAKSILPKGVTELDDLVNEISGEKEATRLLRAELEKDKRAAEQARQKMEIELQNLEETKQSIIRSEKERIMYEAAALQKQIQKAASALRKSKSKERIEQAKSAIEAVKEELSSKDWQIPQVDPEQGDIITEFQELSVGDAVKVIDTSIRGTVAAVFEKTGEVEVHAGKSRFKVSAGDLQKISSDATPPSRKHVYQPSGEKGHRSLELDLRGRRADEVEAELDAYLNDVSIAGFQEVRVIHGYGTGTVRQIVRDMLASHPLVRSFRSGKDYEGGDGVTLVKL